ncbi:MAG TPA: hypothetical protein VEI82_05060 [Myxococcota bacterium]|nr:hypothetical protein [Myxococcota bacterium]
MRALPVFAALGLSLLFSVGGVAIVGRADAPGQTPIAGSPAVSQSIQPRATDPSPQLDQRQCGAPRHFPSSYKGPMELRPGTAKKSDFIPVNTRGYNYALPGEVQFDPTGKARAQAKSDAKSAPASPSAPAAPGK